MIRAIIFDCFGVLTSDAWLPFKRKHFGHDAALSQQATDLNKQVDAGLSDYSDFIEGVADLADMPASQARAEIENNVANEEIFEYIQGELKPRYKIGLLSNAGDNWLDTLFSSEQAALFDAICLSYDTGFIKPDRRAYEAVISKLGVDAGECIFVDDQERYCTAARETGMQAIHYKEFEQFRNKLEQLLKTNGPEA